jgi:hypothetical protein
VVRAHPSTTRPHVSMPSEQCIHAREAARESSAHDTRLGFQCVALTRRLVTRAVAGGGGRQTRCDVHGLVYPRQRVRSGRVEERARESCE